jgi:hypothetical protein
MAADDGAVDHVLPVVGKPKLDQRIEHGVPDTLLRLAPEANIDRVPLAVSLMHVSPGTSDPKDMQHAIEKPPVIVRRPRLATALRREQRPHHSPLFVRQIAAGQTCLQKAVLKQRSRRLATALCQQALVSERRLSPHSRPFPIDSGIPRTGRSRGVLRRQQCASFETRQKSHRSPESRRCGLVPGFRH